MTPGSRKRRWRAAKSTEATIMLFIGLAAALGAASQPNAAGATVLALVALTALICAYLNIVSARRGWRVRYDLPPWAHREIRMPGLRGEIARKAAADTLREAKNPGRRKYKFDPLPPEESDDDDICSS